MLRRILAIFGVSIGVAICAMAWAEINTALSAIKVEFHATVAELQWVMNTFGIAMTSCVVIGGRLADRFGRRKVYLVGIGLAIVGLLGGGFSTHLYLLYIFQVILGLSCAITVPVSQAVLSSIYPEENRAQALGIWASVIGISLALGPLVSGVIVEFLNWQWVYWVDVPFAVVSFWLVWQFVPESKKEGDYEKIDWGGSGLLVISISFLILAVIQGGIWSTGIIATCYVISAVALIALIWFERYASSPIIHQELFRSKQFLVATFCNFFTLFYVWASFFLIPLYLQTIRHFSPLYAGLLMLLVSVPLAVLSMFIGRLFNKVGPRPLIALGFVFIIVSTILQLFFDVNSSLVLICFGAVFYGIGWGFVWSPSTTAAVSTLSVNEAGIASGTFVTFQEIGGNLGLAITVAVARLSPQLEVGYRHGMFVLLGVAIFALLLTPLLKNIKPDPVAS